MTLTVELDEQRVAAWQRKVASQELTLEAWLQKLADDVIRQREKARCCPHPRNQAHQA